MNPTNRIVHGLWLDHALSSMELLTLHSFTAMGHRFMLWVYDEPDVKLPDGAELKDADSIIPRGEVFRYRHANQFGHGKGSPAGFSDLFRYILLHKHGGWWVDMDVTCLKPFDFDQEYVFRKHHDFAVVGNMMKCPPGAMAMKDAYNVASGTVNSENRDWHLPVKILNDQISLHNLNGFTRDFSNADRWPLIRKMIAGKLQIPEEWHAIHWVNVEWSRNRLDKNFSLKNSVYGQLLDLYGLRKDDYGLRETLRQRIRISLFVAAARQLPAYIVSRL
jgi:hypothetical protein